MYKIKLTPYSKIFYIEWLLNPDGYSYNIAVDRIIAGNIKVDRLKSALKRYIEENLLLNSHIQIIDHEPHWVKNLSISDLEYLDLNYLLDFDIDIDVEMEEYAKARFDLLTGPLYRFKLVEIEKNVYRFVLVLHHLVLAGVSADDGVFHSISKYYNDENYHEKTSIEEQIRLNLELTNKLCSRLEQSIQKLSYFWDKQLSNVTPIDLECLKIKSVGKKKQYGTCLELKSINFEFDEITLEKLNKLKRQYAITPYIYGLCIFAALLYRYTNNERFAITLPVAIKEGIDFMYGTQLNTILVPYFFDEKTTIVDLFKQSKEFFKSLKEGNINYSYYPITNIMQSLSKKAGKSFLDVSFIQTDLKNTHFNFNDVTNIAIKEDLNADGINILVFEQEYKEMRLNYRVKYCHSVVDTELLSGFLGNYRQMFTEILDELLDGKKNKTVDSLDILSQEKYLQLLYSFNTTYVDCDKSKTIKQLFEEQVRKTPNNVAVVYEGKQLTYKELNNRANQVANYLISTYKPNVEDLVCFYLGRSEYAIIAILSILKAGCAYVPIGTNLPQELVRHILKDTKTKLVVTIDEHVEKLQSFINTEESKKEISIISINNKRTQEKLAFQNTNNTQISTMFNNLLYVIYTSGTTGYAKGVLIEDHGIVNFVKYMISYAALNCGSRGSVFASFSFDASVTEIFPILLSGGSIYIVPEGVADPRKLNYFFESNKISFALLTTKFAERFFYVDNSSLKFLIVAGEKLVKYKKQKYKVINAYGPTETSVHATSFIVDKDYNDIPIGKPIYNVKCYVLSKGLNLMPIGAIGELYIGGEGLARGYLNLPELTKEKFIPNLFQTDQERAENENLRLYKTGDLVRWLPDGNLEYIGRNDFQIKIRGFRIELAEIESKLLSFSEIKQAVVLAIDYHEDDTQGNDKYLVAYYVSDNPINEQILREYLTSKLCEYMIPRYFVWIEMLPMTSNGKVDRNALQKPKIIKSDYIKPKTEKERLICEAFEKVLHLKTVSSDGDFFDLGGDSLKAIVLTNILQENFEISVQDVFKFRKPQAIAEHLVINRNNLYNKLERLKTLYANTIQLEPTVLEEEKEYLFDSETFVFDPNILKPIKNIVLTGATGFLGSNLLNQLLQNTNYKIILLVRADSIEDAISRLSYKFKFYFDQNLEDFLNSRVQVICSDLEKPLLGLTPESYQVLADITDSIIHAASLVKHFGDSDKFYSANVISTINLLKLAELTENKDFHYISTYLLLKHFVKTKIFLTENDIPENILDCGNIYLQTKLAAEKEVFKARAKINANIYRLGNLALIAENGRTQENGGNNAFFQCLKEHFKLKCIPYEDSVVEISPADLSALAIVKLFDKKHLSNGVYHVFNPYKLDLASVFKNNIKTVPFIDFMEILAQKLTMENNADIIYLLQKYFSDFNLQRIKNVNVSQCKTENILKQLNFGWSNFVDIIGEIMKKTIGKSKTFESLDSISKIIPAPMYWLNKDGVMVGLNKHLLDGIGATSFEDIGESAYAMYPYELANVIALDNKQVIDKQEPSSVVEVFQDIKTGKIKYAKSLKAPLYDDDGNIEGLIGISVDITAEKEAEALEIRKVRQQTEMYKHAEFRKTANQVVHDIRSPLAGIRMVLEALKKDTPELVRKTIMEASNKIDEIARRLLYKYKEGDQGGSDQILNAKSENNEECVPVLSQDKAEKNVEPTLIYLVLEEVLSEKKYQYFNEPVTFKLQVVKNDDEDDESIAQAVFVNISKNSFVNMISNVVNNAVDSFCSKNGYINVVLVVEKGRAGVIICDNGKGMSAELIDNILSGSGASEKKAGHGIGMRQILETVKKYQGTIEIDSKEESGTRTTITFPRCKYPDWFVERIDLNKGDTLIILDDDYSIHGAWTAKLENEVSAGSINTVHFYDGNEALKFINSFEDKSKILLLSDYELLDQELNGLDVIEKAQVKSILVTSYYHRQVIRDKSGAMGIKILPKPLAHITPIIVGKKDIKFSDDIVIAFFDEYCKNTVVDKDKSDVDDGCKLDKDKSDVDDGCKLDKDKSDVGDGCKLDVVLTDTLNESCVDDENKIDAVFIDDSHLFLDTLSELFKIYEKVVDLYDNPKIFLNNVSKYSKDTKIFIDNDLGCKITGADVADKLNQDGYTKLYLLSGTDFVSEELPEYLTIISKLDIDKIKNLG